jgi:hypothetical protein
MNIWALEKDVRIKHMLLLLQQQLEFEISESASLDANAVRLKAADDEDLSVYLYTYGQNPDHYGIHLEYPLRDAVETSQQFEIQENLAIEQLVELICVHFGVAPKGG